MTDVPDIQEGEPAEFDGTEATAMIEDQLATSKYRRRILTAWAVFIGWSVLVIALSGVVAAMRGAFDWIAGAVLMAIPLGMMFMFPVWMAATTKVQQDEIVREFREARRRGAKKKKPGAERTHAPRTGRERQQTRTT